MIWAIGGSLLLLVANAFFVAAEFALVAARRSEIEARPSSWMQRQTLRAMDRVSLMMATAQIGITVCTIGLGALAKPALAALFENLFGIVLPLGWALALGTGGALVLVATLHVVLGEMVPKNAALARSSSAALLLSPPLRALSFVFWPLVWSLNEAANGVLRVLRVEPRQSLSAAFTRDEVAGLVEESRVEGKLEGSEGRLAASTLRFAESSVRQIAIPLGRWVHLDNRSTPRDLELLSARYGYSRFPVIVHEELQGYLHLKDALQAPEINEPFPRSTLRSLPALDPDDSLRSALEIMQHYGAHLARVENNQGVWGLVALEDVIEELVGEVRDVAGGIVRVR